MKNLAVIDIGKSNAKVALVDLATLKEVALRKSPNPVLVDGIYPHVDVERLWAFILESLSLLNREHGVDVIIVTTHGATAALLDAQGELVLPVLDYEFAGPEEYSSDYDAIRPAFAETFSPRLPLGLNLGAQIYWQQRKYPDAFARVKTILMYPQYWAGRLCGVHAAEVTSLGCHTDLWLPQSSGYSSLVEKCDWLPLMPGLHKASEVLGSLVPEIAQITGLAVTTPIYCGIHDSNASLVPHLIDRDGPCAVVSTGTWVIAMALGSKAPPLDQSRDMLMNVNAFGAGVPSARFMGGREYQIILEGVSATPTETDIVAVLEAGAMLLPAVVGNCGPFPNHLMKWQNAEKLSPAEREVVTSFYLALMTLTCLNLIWADGDIIVEGPFSTNTLYLDMLAAASKRQVLVGSEASTGTTIGAAMLVANHAPATMAIHQPTQALGDALAAYAHAWCGEL